MKGPAVAQPAGGDHGAAGQKVQVGAVTGGMLAGGQFDEGDVLEVAELGANLGQQ